MGLLDWFGTKGRKEARARKKELAGQLDKAVELYLAAELPDEAARVLLLRADAEADLDKRMMLCAQAARVGGDGEMGRQARRRKALLGFDVVKGARGATMHGELLLAAKELEEVDEWQAAAEAYALAESPDDEIRVLKEAGAIELLEERLQQTSEAARKERNRADLIRRIRDLDTIAERREAIRAGRQWLEHGHDEQIQLEIDRIESRLVAGPAVTLEVGGERERYVLGSKVSLGRAQADILIASGGVSRQHLELYREEGEAKVRDLDTRNGTLLAGARMSGSLPIGDGIELSLAGQVPCKLAPLSAAPDAPIAVEVAGERYIVPLGPLRIAHFRLVDAHDGDDRFLVLRTPKGQEPPYMAGLRLGFEIQLCLGDRIGTTREGPILLAVPDPSASFSGAP